MAEDTSIRFDDGAAYEEFMGKWSQLAGERFLEWLTPAAGLRWLDVGCGNGAFTEMLSERCAPAALQGIDPSPAQIEFAARRLPGAQFQLGDAMRLPHADDSFDAAVMALVIFFVPEPARALAEMARVVRPGGTVSSYAWDILGGGFPFAMLQQELEAEGIAPLWPPSVEASRRDALQALWAGAGLVDIEHHEIQVQRSFTDFETFWKIAQSGPRLAPRFASMADGDRARIKDRLRTRLVSPQDGQVHCRAAANAVRGRRPG